MNNGEYKDQTKVAGAPLQVSDVVEYPNEYVNKITHDPTDSGQIGISEDKGWIVTANTTNKQGDKVVRIATAGIPETATISTEDFQESNRENLTTETLLGMKLNGCELKSLNKYGEQYYLPQYASSYSVINITDSLDIYKSVGCEGDVVINGGYYWVNAYSDGYGLGYVTAKTAQNYTEDGGTSGIRPAMNLKNDIQIYKIWDDANESYSWKFAN